jgi:hypothetical protein
LDIGGVRSVVEMLGKGRGGEVEGVDSSMVRRLGRGVVGVSEIRTGGVEGEGR